MADKYRRDGRAWIGAGCLLSFPVQEQGFFKGNLGLNHHECSYLLCSRVIFPM